MKNNQSYFFILHKSYINMIVDFTLYRYAIATGGIIMARLWNWIDGKNFTNDNKIRIFLLLNCLKYSLYGFAVWLLISRVAFTTYDWAICFVGYPAFFGGYVGGFLFSCRNE